MATTNGALKLYDSVAEYIGDGTIDMDDSTFKLMLTTSAYTPSLAHTTKANVTNEIANGNGYTTGGITLVNPTWTRTGNVAKFDADNPVWTTSGGSIGPAYYAVLYKSGTANSITDPLIGYTLLDNTPANVTVTDPGTLTINISANGLFTLTITP
jgi:hypothetical protein